MILTSYNKAAGKALRSLRDSENYTLDQVASMLGVEKKKYREMEEGFHIADRHIKQICEIYGVKISQFFFLIEAEFSALVDFNWKDKDTEVVN